MASAVAKVARLKPEIRLGQAISEFQADLSPSQKAILRTQQVAGTPPTIRDVMQLTAEINRATGTGGQCYGPRLTNVLQAVQEFAALGDIVLGGTQNLLACGVWGLVRMTFLSIVKYSTYLERLSMMLMGAGRSAPRYQIMGALYPKSERLRSCMLEYFIVIVNLCRHALRLSQSSALGQWVSTLTDSRLDNFHADLDLWTTMIKEEVSLLMAQQASDEIAETAWFRTRVSRHFESQSHAKRLRLRQRILDACSSHDVVSSWKRIRKLGHTTIQKSSTTYATWMEQGVSNTLVCIGTLGSGKTVLLANIVDDLNLQASQKSTISYFFCQHDMKTSLTARTVIGSLARQLLHTQPDLDCASDVLQEGTANLDIDQILALILRILPSTCKAYFVIDGLMQCHADERKVVIDALRLLQGKISMSLCVSLRSEPSESMDELRGLFALSTFTMPSDNPDIDEYIDGTLERSVEAGTLVVQDPFLILEIKDYLSHRAQGMFLWVTLQIKALCFERTDADIRRAFADIPDDLSGIYRHILTKSRVAGAEYQLRILELALAACRPLTLEEMREALGVTPGCLTWEPQRLLNNINATLACCGGLLRIDEEDFSVRIVHHSVKTFLSDSHAFEGFDLHEANCRMAKIILTYLNYATFSKQLSTLKAPRVKAGSVTSAVISSTAESVGQSAKLALKLLRLKKGKDRDIGHTLLRTLGQGQQKKATPLAFYDYASSCWQEYMPYMFLEAEATAQDNNAFDDQADPHSGGPDARPYPSVSQLLKGLFLAVNVNTADSQGRTPLSYAAEFGYYMFVKLLVSQGAEDLSDCSKNTPLMWAIKAGSSQIMEALLKTKHVHLNAINSDGHTPLSLAMRSTETTMGKRLLQHPEIDANLQNESGWTPLMWTVNAQSSEWVTLLFGLAKVDPNIPDKNGDTPLHAAARLGDVEIACLLVLAKADLNPRNRLDCTPFWLAAYHGRMGMVTYMLGLNDAEDGTVQERVLVNAKDKDGITPFMIAALQGHDRVVNLLVSPGVLPLCLTTLDSVNEALWAAAAIGQAAVVTLARIEGVNINYETPRCSTPLWIAAHNGHAEVVKFLVHQSGVDLNAVNSSGVTPLWTAAEAGHTDVVEILASLDGVNLHATDPGGTSVLLIASRNGHTDVVLKLVNITPAAVAVELFTLAQKECVGDLVNMLRYLRFNKTLQPHLKDVFWPLLQGHGNWDLTRRVQQLLLPTIDCEIDFHMSGSTSKAYPQAQPTEKSEQSSRNAGEQAPKTSTSIRFELGETYMAAVPELTTSS
ncbi:ankyrin repeat domain-containing protein [Aspergillus mulundensis]|uniref:Uncharacterized protein n=1 Tax=Aspergillus mulundensis TaxID=1810919 RepID=A0A3D8SUW9_9EURO|nr:hypothetical protein DSM5745_01839 [Aspergillus mulundensis]RDW90064.1 hypothetical protein DSM5745_01839 [Aspergillus mulundensis]